MSHSGAGPRWGRISTSPHRKPATRPPMWPPIEMPGMAKVSTRLMISSPPRFVRMMGILRITMPATAQPTSPKATPDAPAVMARGLSVSRSAPAEPPMRHEMYVSV